MATHSPQTSLKKIIGNSLREFRYKKGHSSLYKFARRVGVSEQAINQYENGKRLPAIPTLIQIVKVLELTPAEIKKLVWIDYDRLYKLTKKLND